MYKFTKHKSFLIGVTLVITFSLLVGSLTLVIIYTNQNSSNLSSKNEEIDFSDVTNSTDIKLNKEPSPDDLNTNNYVSKHRIIYLEDGNVWISSQDGAEKIQVTTDAWSEVDGAYINYSAVSWYGPGIASYARCHLKCEIYLYDLDLSKTGESILFTGVNLEGVTRIMSFSWGDSKSFKLLGILAFFESEGRDKVVFSNSQTTQTLYTYTERLGRGVGLLDDVSVKFAPEAKYLSVQNTYNSAYEKNDEQIIIFDLSTGNIDIRLGNEYLGHVFDSSNSFFTAKLDSENPSAYSLYKVKLGADFKISPFLNEGIIPTSISSNRLIGNYVGLGSVFVAEVSLTSSDLIFPGEAYMNAQLIGNGKVFIAQVIEESIAATFPQGIKRLEFTEEGTIYSTISETASIFEIEK